MKLTINQTHPELAAELADKSLASTLTSGSHKKVEWNCANGHTFWAVVNNRVHRGSRCSYCFGTAVLTGFNDFCTLHPDLAAEMVNPELGKSVRHGSKNKVDWLCVEHGVFSQAFTDRAQGQGCPRCGKASMGKISMSKAVKNNNLVEKFPGIAAQWSSNNDTKPNKYSASSHFKALWTCPKHGDWPATISNRTGRKSGCPTCARPARPPKAIKPFIPISQSHPDLAKQLVDQSLADKLTYGSRKKVEWECSEGHKWVADCNMRTGGDYARGCAICGNRKLVAGVNDAATTHPHFADMWSPNNDFSMQDYVAGSGQQALFVCKNGHEFKSTMHNVLIAGTGCMKCPEPNRIRVDWKDHNFMNQWDSEKNGPLPRYFTLYNPDQFWWTCDKGHSWKAVPRNRLRGFNCPKCAFTSGSSKPEKELADFVESLSFDVLRNDRTLIAPREVDVLVPSKNVAFEYNGLYWHTEAKVGRNLHYDKWLACKNAGVHLVTIWEHDWLNNNDVVKSMVRAKLGINNGTVGARKTNVLRIDFSTAAEFLNRWHIQGSAKGSDYLGLYHNNGLIGVAVFKRFSGGAYLERYASSVSIPGGLDKCMATLPYGNYVTFADLSVSSGALYCKTDWKYDRLMPPDYRYWYDNTLVHKFNFRLKRFRDDPALLYDPKMTERQLAELNGIERVYNCGKIRYTRSI